MTLEKLQQNFPSASLETWHQHINGGGWVQNTATVDETAYVGPNARVSGNALVSGYARVSGNADINSSKDYMHFVGVAEWGELTAFKCSDGLWRIVCGCRYFTITEALEYWSDKDHRTRTLKLVQLIQEITQ